VINARATGETGDFWTGTDVRRYRTGALVYQPNYNRYGGAPNTYVDNTVVANRFPSGTVTLTGQTVVEGRQITLVAVNGSLDRASAGATSVDVRPVSSSTTTISVTDSGTPVTIRLPTQLSLSTWEGLLADQFTSNGGHVVESRLRTEPLAGVPGTRLLVVELEAGVDYTLRLAKVGVGTGVEGTDAAYVTDVTGDGTAVSEGESRLVTVEVRDRYNNPVSGTTVNADADDGSLVDPDDVGSSTVTTGTDGRATFRYTTGPSAGGSDDTLRFSTGAASGSAFNESDPLDVGMTVTVESTTPTSSTGGGSAPYTVEWTDGSETTLDVGASGDELDLTALVTDATAGDEVTVEGASVDFSVNDTGVAEISPQSDDSNAVGEARVTLTAKSVGVVRVYAVSGGASDTINVTIENVPSDPGPTGRLAYDDDNDNGQFDSGEDTYTRSELQSGFDEQANLVVPSDVGTLDPQGNAIKATTLDIDVDVVSSDSVTLRATKAGGGAVELNGNRVESTQGGVTIRGVEVRAADATVVGGDGTVTVRATDSGGGSAVFDGATVEGESIVVRAIDITGRNSDFDTTDGSITMRATDSGGGPLDLAGAQLVTSGGGITLDARGDTTVGDTVEQESRLEAPGNSITASVNGGGTFFYDGVVIIDSDNTAEVSPDGAIATGDSTESGSVR
jgi:hypothetical protein